MGSCVGSNLGRSLDDHLNSAICSLTKIKERSNYDGLLMSLPFHQRPNSVNPHAIEKWVSNERTNANGQTCPFAIAS